MSRSKPNKQTTKKENEKSRQKTSSSAGKIVFPISVLIGLAAYYMYYVIFTRTPEMPKVDLDQYWGHYPINPQQDLSIRPYKIEFSDVMVNDLKERLLHRRPFTPPLEDAGFTYGFNTNFLTRVLDYWQNSYNFKEREQFLNQYNHFVTNVQGLDIHYMHIKPKAMEGVTVVPLLMLHGWPGSFREFYEIIPKLTTPRSGYKFVFEVIVPSLPGYGYSQGAVRPGLGTAEMAVVMRNLMKRIGHSRYYVQGGDVGHAVGGAMATLFPDHVLGFHTNTPVLLHPIYSLYALVGSIWPSLVLEPELHDRMFPLTEHAAFTVEESGYMHIQATKPDTVGIALTDSPAGLAAYILEKFSTWTNKSFRKASDGNLLAKFTLTHLLDNIMVYWSSNSITTAVRVYSEAFSKRELALNMDGIPTDVPTWGIKFKHEIVFQPDSVLKTKYRNYLHSTIVEDGGHFAAFENPDIMADDIFEAVDTFQEFHAGGKKPNEQSTEVNYETAKTIYEFTVKDINAERILCFFFAPSPAEKLDKYKGHVTIIVNVASQCGLTDTNYKQLNELYEKYGQSRGLRILAFPCNQFNGQEPGTLKDILQFTKQRGVQFDVLEKVEVNGENAHPLWKFLKRSQGGTLGDFIKWNFSKFIIDKNGVPVERLAPTVKPLELEPYLAKYW